MKNKLTVVKLGGNCMDDEALLHTFLKSFSNIPHHKILVHGGGKLATNLCTQLNISSTMLNGRRITCEKTLQVVTMCYAGAVNKDLVARLQAIHCNAIGLSGPDGNLVRAVKRAPLPVDYGFAGDPAEVNSGLLSLMLNNNYVPVVSPITHDHNGQLLNSNADSVAAAVATALTSMYDVHLLYVFDKKGVLADAEDENSVMPFLSDSTFEEMKLQNKINGGMHPKLASGYSALRNNVSQVTLQHLSSLDQQSAGTTLVL